MRIDVQPESHFGVLTTRLVKRSRFKPLVREFSKCHLSGVGIEIAALPYVGLGLVEEGFRSRELPIRIGQRSLLAVPVCIPDLVPVAPSVQLCLLLDRLSLVVKHRLASLGVYLRSKPAILNVSHSNHLLRLSNCRN